jgi:hypothetical protein
VARRVAVTDPALLERLALPDEAFYEHFLALVANFPPREWTSESFERGLRYPWSRPQRSYLLRDGRTELLHELDAEQRGALLARHAGPRSVRFGLLAFGSNAAPKNLAIKLAHHPEPDEREVLALTGELHGLDVAASAAVSIYGAMPATLTASPGTAVRAALLLVTAKQLTTLAWGEIPYRLGRLSGAPFVLDEGVGDLAFDAPLAFVSRWGAFAPDGDPIALAAVRARDRTLPAWTQRELLDRASAVVLGPDGGGAEGITRAVCAGAAEMAAQALPALRTLARPFDFDGWAPLGADGTL